MGSAVADRATVCVGPQAFTLGVTNLVDYPVDSVLCQLCGVVSGAVAAATDGATLDAVEAAISAVTL